MRINTRLISLITALSLLGILMTAGSMWAAKYATLVWEAESVTLGKANPTYTIEKAPQDPKGSKASGGKVLAVPKVEAGKKVKTDSVTYKIDIKEAGKYILWVRTIWSTGCGNTFGIKINGAQTQFKIGGDATYDTYEWRRLSDGNGPRFLNFKKGVNTITLVVTESGTMADEFMLTTDKNKKPVGAYTPTTPSVLVK